MKQSQIDSLRDFAIEHLPRAKAAREQTNRFGLTHDHLYAMLAGIVVSVRAKAGTTAIEHAAAKVLDSVCMLCLVQEPPLTAKQRTEVLGWLARDAKELCSLTGKAIAWLDTVPTTPEPEEEDIEQPAAPAAQALTQSIAGRLLTTRQAAEVLGYTPGTLRQQRSDDRNVVTPIQIAPRQWRYSGDDILAFMNRKKK